MADIGETVIVHPAGSDKPGGYPGTVTHVHEDGTLNVSVCDDRVWPLRRPCTFARVKPADAGGEADDVFVSVGGAGRPASAAQDNGEGKATKAKTKASTKAADSK